VTSARDTEGLPNFVVTLDDITDLVTAQRTSAWADVARRIAHEIKNPLTPIQLSAERLKRKYGKLIKEDREIFDQCTDTIVRQVDDIKRMVDEFSSFARMPKARPEQDDLNECVRQVCFLMRVGNADIDIVETLPAGPTLARFDRRLFSQALTNIVKNATEGIAAREGEHANEKGRVEIRVSTHDSMAQIDVIDNGKGFPEINRQRLLEPYMTTRSDGTGLGLPIVAKIIEDHGGRLELLDAPAGRGACVRMLLPITDDKGSSEGREQRAVA
jgi:two-component system nitrogen regulation sensor histidine kinase NtrY